MKINFIAGFLSGAVIFGAAGALAAGLVANQNPFPVQLNGNDVDIEGYNIEGSTYFKLRDIADVVGGFDVDFNNDTIQLSKDGYVYDNTVTQRPFVDKITLIEDNDSVFGGATVYYDLDFDGNIDTIQLRQSGSTTDDLMFNTRKTELIINGDSLVIENAYKTHGCGAMFVCDIDQTDNALDIMLLMSYKSTDAYIYQYKNGSIVQVGNSIPIGGFQEVTEPEYANLSVNDTSWQPAGFTISVAGNSYYFEKYSTGNFVEQ